MTEAATRKEIIARLILIQADLQEHHDTVDTDSPLVQAPNWSMKASNWIEWAIEEIEGARQ